MPVPNIEHLVVLPSLLCNIRCNFCYQSRFDHQVHLSDEILYDKLKGIYETTKQFTLLGGEPTVIPGLDEYAHHVLKTYPEIGLRIVTNGVKLSARWKEILASPRVDATISLNASRGEVYEATQNVKNGGKLWERAFANVLETLAVRSTSAKNLTLSMVATQHTRDDILDFVALCYVLGADAKILVDCRGYDYQSKDGIFSAYPMLRGLAGMNLGTTEVHVINLLDEANIQGEGSARLTEDLQARAFNAELRLRDYPSHVRQRSEDLVRNTRETEREPGRPFGAINGMVDGREVCIAPWKGLVVGHSGEVYCCSRMTNRPLGNINASTIEEILGGDVANGIRERMLNGHYDFCDPDCPANLAKKRSLRTALRYFERGDYSEALAIYRELFGTLAFDAAELYRYAYCEHVQGSAHRSLEIYTSALMAGFDEFWVLLHRAQAAAAIGDLDQAQADILRASELRPEDETVVALRSHFESLSTAA